MGAAIVAPNTHAQRQTTAENTHTSLFRLYSYVQNAQIRFILLHVTLICVFITARLTWNLIFFFILVLRHLYVIQNQMLVRSFANASSFWTVIHATFTPSMLITILTGILSDKQTRSTLMLVDLNLKSGVFWLLELRCYSDLTQNVKELYGIYCLNFLKSWQNLKTETYLFHTKSNLLFLVCRQVVGFLFASHCFFRSFHFVRTWCLAWERYGLSDVATVTGGRFFVKGHLKGRVVVNSHLLFCLAKPSIEQKIKIK